MAFFDHGLLLTPWGTGTYSPVRDSTDTLSVVFAGSTHTVIMSECFKFASTRISDGESVNGWVQASAEARGCAV
eukprot:1524533-Prymnesium_polylepis.1